MEAVLLVGELADQLLHVRGDLLGRGRVPQVGEHVRGEADADGDLLEQADRGAAVGDADDEDAHTDTALRCSW